MNDYEAIFTLYEGYLGQSINHGPNAKYIPNEGGNSYRKGALPTAVPGNSGNLYAANQISNITTPISDEEVEHDPVIIKINELIDQANNDEMMYAVHMLGTLKAFIKKTNA